MTGGGVLFFGNSTTGPCGGYVGDTVIYYMPDQVDA